MIKPLLGLALLIACASATAYAASSRTYAAQCSNQQLREKPVDWDVGCTGGSPAATGLKWSGWGTPKATAPGKIRRRYDTTGNPEDRIYPLFDGRVTLTKVRRFPCNGRPRQYTRALIEYTVPAGFEHDEPGPKSVTYDLGKRCPVYVLGEVDNGIFTGIGVERPRRFSNVPGFEHYTGLRWRNWGMKRTTARGRFSTRLGPSRSAHLTAYGRATDASCDDGPAYSKLRIKLGGQPALVLTLCQ